MHKSRRYAWNGNTVGKIREKAVEAGLRVRNIKTCKLTDDAQDPGAQDAPKNISFYIFNKKYGCDQKSDKSQQNGYAF